MAAPYFNNYMMQNNIIMLQYILTTIWVGSYNIKLQRAEIHVCGAIKIFLGICEKNTITYIVPKMQCYFFSFVELTEKKPLPGTHDALFYLFSADVGGSGDRNTLSCVFFSFFKHIYIYIYTHLVRHISSARTASYFLLNYITVSRLCLTTTSMANYPRVHFILEFLSRLPPSLSPHW